MTSKPQQSPTRAQRKAAAEAAARAAKAAEHRRELFKYAAIIAVVVLVVGGLFLIFRSSNGPGGEGGPVAGGSGKYVYQTGTPGPGDQAIDFTLPSTTGGEVSLQDFRGKTVLTYWHEGLGCQPCWDQIKDIEADRSALQDAGIDDFVSVTSGPVDALAQKMADEGLHTTMLADTDLDVSRQYDMNSYGMMGDSRDGHTFMLIGPDGKILWRADYGGAPNYTMYVPVEEMLKQLKAGRTS